MKYKVYVYEANVMTYEIEAKNEDHAGDIIMDKGSRLNMTENLGREEQYLPKTTKIEEFRIEEVIEC
jgi:hypothetical protein